MHRTLFLIQGRNVFPERVISRCMTHSRTREDSMKITEIRSALVEPEAKLTDKCHSGLHQADVRCSRDAEHCLDDLRRHEPLLTVQRYITMPLMPLTKFQLYWDQLKGHKTCFSVTYAVIKVGLINEVKSYFSRCLITWLLDLWPLSLNTQPAQIL